MPITVDLEKNPLFVEIFERYAQRGELASNALTS